MTGKEDQIIENNLRLLRSRGGAQEYLLVDENGKSGGPRKGFVIRDLLQQHGLVSYRNGAVFISIKGQEILSKGGWIKHKRSIETKNNERENLEFEKLKLEIQALKRGKKWQNWVNIIAIATFILSVVLGLQQLGLF